VGEGIRDRSPADRPDAIFAANDLLALGALQSLVMSPSAGEGSRTVRVPEDIALIGYDDIDFSAAAVIPLSSVRQPAALIGSTAVDLLLEQQQGAQPREHVVFQPVLVVRASTAG
jgi:LacI family transcriptional regulator